MYIYDLYSLLKYLSFLLTTTLILLSLVFTILIRLSLRLTMAIFTRFFLLLQLCGLGLLALAQE